MRRQIIVNASDLESRVAILEESKLAELQVEREPRIVGNIYKGRVLTVLPGMDAAFADIGLERNVFLCADDVSFARDHDGEAGAQGKREKGRGGARRGREADSAPITEKLKVGQEVVVQISRAAVGSKGARANTRLSLPGRYLVLMIGHGGREGVSRRIEEEKERERLRGIGEELCPSDCGLILRTEAEGAQKQELKRDLEVLLELRRRVEDKAKRSRAPALIHEDLTLTYQVIRDAFTEDVEQMVIDSKSAYDNALELLALTAPKLKKRVHLYQEAMPIFAKYGLEEEIEQLLHRRVWLAAGGYISIDQAEAFTAIDVNTGRYTGSRGLAETILHTNLEAAEEVARQLRLRDLGGIIVIDFIDMERSGDRSKVIRTFEQALKRDRQKTKILHLSRLGLVEMTRKRRGESLLGLLSETCPQCAGIGRVRSPLTVALQIERQLGQLSLEKKPETLLVEAHPRVIGLLLGSGGARAKETQQKTKAPIYLRSNDSLRQEEFRLQAARLSELPSLVSLFRQGEQVEARAFLPEEPAAADRAVAIAHGYWVFLPGPGAAPDDTMTVRLTAVGPCFGEGEVVAGGEQAAVVREEAARRERPSARRRKRSGRPAAPRGESTPASPTGEVARAASSQEERRGPPPALEELPSPEEVEAGGEQAAPGEVKGAGQEVSGPRETPPPAPREEPTLRPASSRRSRWVHRSARRKPGRKFQS